MSRIDEALRRAAGRGVVGVVPDVDSAGYAEAREALLEQYPIEATAPLSKPAVTQALPSTPGSRSPLRTSSAVTVRPALPPAPATRDIAFDRALDHKLVVAQDAPAVSVEQYRRLAGSLFELQTESGLKTLMVTSALPREGKTLTATNLALTLSESYRRRVLLIDADLRRPSVHQVFRLPNTSGLSDVLQSDRGNLPLFAVSPLLTVLPAGTPDDNPTARLSSDAMRQLLEEAAATFDWVLIDAPPVTMLPDAHLLARLTRAVLLVIGAGSTPYNLVNRAIDEVGRDLIVGTVLNRIDSQHIPANGYYDQYTGKNA